MVFHSISVVLVVHARQAEPIYLREKVVNFTLYCTNQIVISRFSLRYFFSSQLQISSHFLVCKTFENWMHFAFDVLWFDLQIS